MQKLAILDIDNTLYKWKLWIDLLKKLMKDKLFQKETGDEILEIFTAYRNNKIAREEIFDKIYPLYGEWIKWLEESIIRSKANEVYNNYKSWLFGFTRSLIQYLQSKGYYILALSWSSDEIVSCLCEDIWIDISFGAKIESHYWVYTWKLIQACSSPERKKDIVIEHISNNWIKVDRSKSIAIWDSETEALLFDMTWVSLVFEPHESFKPIAENNPNRTIVNRSNILSTIKSLV